MNISAVPEMPAMSEMGFGINNTESTTPEISSSVPKIEVPTMDIPAVPEMPAMSEMGFGINNTGSTTPEIPSSVPEVEVPIMEVPVTSPIIETPIASSLVEMPQQIENSFSFENNNMNPVEVSTPAVETPVVPEFKIPEPIIVTDYSKQYDPVMPQYGPVAPAVDFKEVINAIRECSNKIEQYGFKIDVEEIDLVNLYQAVFKIEKQ